MTTITIDSDVFAQHIHSLIEVMRMPNTEHVADAHNKAVRFLRAALAAQPQTLDEAMAVPRAMAQAYENGYNAALANGPAWHDAPTVPGIWLCDEGDICYTWTAHNIEILDIQPEDGVRWFGPIRTRND